MNTGTPQNQPSFFTSDALPSPADILRRERGQAWIRVAVCIAAGIYLAIASYPEGFHSIPFWAVIVVAYTSFSIVFVWHVSRSTTSFAWRRYAVIMTDLSAVTLGIIAAGESGIPLFALYVWVTLGNGFRFGIGHLAVSAILSLTGFLGVLVWVDVWQENFLFSVGVLTVLLVVPLGAAYALLRSRPRQRTIVSDKEGNVDTDNIGLRLFRLLGMRRRSTGDAMAPSPSDVILTRERGQAVLRVVVSTVVLLYLVIDSYPFDFSRGMPGWLSFLLGYVTLSAVLASHIIKSRLSYAWRRYVGNIADTAAISFTMIAAGESGIPLFALYLWVTFGNGFRYGIPALIVSAALSVVGFSIVVAFSPIWQAHPSLIVGVLTSLTMLPLYAGHLLRLLNSALAKANEANAAKGQFIARMSHELRTPLNGIRGSVELLRTSSRLLPDERTLLDVIDDSVGVSLSQIDNVLDFAKLEAGKLVLEPAEFDLHALLNSTVAMVRPAAAQKRLRLLVRISPAMPFALVGDSRHLRGILLNLLSNAVKFTERGFVSLETSSVEEDSQSARVRFEILDTGIGIAATALPRIFDSFSQEDTSTTRKYGGTGLGTAIAKQLVELMGGSIGVQSIKGSGTLFWFEIPFRRGPVHQETILPENANAVLFTTDSGVEAYFRSILPRRLSVASSEDGTKEIIARGLRLGNPAYLVVIDDEVAFTAAGEHRLSDVADRALGANIPLALLADRPPAAHELRQWGYSATLPRRPTPSLVYAALHASPNASMNADSKVVSIAPWIWEGRDDDRPRILVADDNETNLMITRRMLEHAGYSVDTVDNGHQAIDRLATGRYRLAVLDMHMPGADGTEVAAQYRALRPRSRLPIIVLTANASIAAQQASAIAGADAYLAKPVTAQDLLSVVKRLLDDTTVEVLAFGQARRIQERVEADEEIIDTSVLAELDRIYRDPDELELLVQGYEREGKGILSRLSAACKSRNHASFCDVVHALKSNAANVGARKLMNMCQTVGALGIVDFMRDREQILGDLDRAFTDSISALRDIAVVPRDQSSD